MALRLLPLVALLGLTHAAIWSITQYNIEVTTLSTGRYATDLTFTDTSTYTLRSPTSPPPTASATSTTTSTDDIYDAVYTTYYIPGNALPSSVIASLNSSTGFGFTSSSVITQWYIDKVYTAPSSCRSQFTFTTSSNLFVPIGAETQLTPTSTTTSAGLSYDYVTAFLPANAINATSTTATTSDFVQSYYIDKCSNPGTRTTGLLSPSSTRYSGGGSYSGGDSYYSFSDNCLGSLCPFWLIYIVVIVPILAFLFLGGLIESYFWFTRLMKGHFALRGVPLLWVGISLWTLCCLRRTRSASPDVHPQLLKQWREMSTGTHIKLWLKYGFRHRDPPQLAAVIGQSQTVPVWHKYRSGPPPGEQPRPGAGGPVGGAGAVGPDGQPLPAGQQPQMTQQAPPPGAPGAPVYYPYPQPFQGAQVWAPQPQPYDPNNPNASAPQSVYYPPPPGSVSNPASSPPPQGGYMYAPPPPGGPAGQQPYGQPQQWGQPPYGYGQPQQPSPPDASRGSPTGMPVGPSPSEYTPAGAGGPFGPPGAAPAAGVGDAGAAPGHAPPQQVIPQQPSPMSSEMAGAGVGGQPTTEAPKGGAEGAARDIGGGEGAPEVVVEQPKSDTRPPPGGGAPGGAGAGGGGAGAGGVGMPHAM